MRESPFAAEPPDAFINRLRRAREGSRSTLGQLLAEFRNYLLLVANRELDDQLRAKFGPSDVVQDTLVQAQQHFADFAGRSEPELRAWLERILWNCCRNVRVAFIGTAKRSLSREVPLDADALGDGILPGLTEQTETPSGLAIANEEARLVDLALARLPPEQCQIIRWHTWESLGFEEIGRRLGRSPDAARRLWLRAIQQLKQEWGAGDGKRSDEQR